MWTCSSGEVRASSRSGISCLSACWPVTGAFVRSAHAARLEVVPYTLDARAGVVAAAREGVDALITDDPLMARRALR